MLPGGSFARVLGIRPLAWIGRLSYGLYLAHWPVNIAINGDRYYSWPPELVFVVRLALAFVLALVSYRYVERPIRTAAWDHPVGRCRFGTGRKPARSGAGRTRQPSRAAHR